MGDGRLQLVPERRAARKKIRPAACGELQTTAKPRTVDRVSGGQFARSPRRSRVHAEYRARGARPASSHRVNRPPGADWSPRAASPPAARQLPRGQRRWPHRSRRPHSERARASACRLTVGASRPSRGERRPWSWNILLACALTSPPSRRRLARGARAAGRRGEPGRLALGRARQDAPLGRRRAGAGVARRGAVRCHPPILVCTCGGMPASAVALVFLPPPCTSPPSLAPLSLPPCVAVAPRTIPRTRSSPDRYTHPTTGQTRATHRRAKRRLFCPARRACCITLLVNEVTRVSAAVVALSPSWDGTQAQACISAALAFAVRPWALRTM